MPDLRFHTNCIFKISHTYLLETQLGIGITIPLRHFGFINNEKERKQLLEPNPKYRSFYTHSTFLYIMVNITLTAKIYGE